MLTLFLLVIFLACTAALWFHGLWSNAVTLISVLVSGMIASNFYEPLTVFVLDSAGAEAYTYLLDFVILWGLFALSFILLRVITDLISPHPVRFPFPVEMAGRSVLAIWIAWVMVSFTAMSMHIAPLPAHPFRGAWTNPASGCFLGMAPDRQWLAFIQSRSRGALSRSDQSAVSPHEGDEGMRVFDPNAEFIIKYHHRREIFENEEAFLVR